MATDGSKRIDVVAGLIFRGGRVLACQRHETGNFPLKWEFPGGKIEKGETASDALRRELKEELAIDILEFAEVYQHEHCYSGGPNVNLRFFKIGQIHGELKNLVFHQIAWVKVTDLQQLDFLEGDKLFVEKLATPDGAHILQ